MRTCVPIAVVLTVTGLLAGYEQTGKSSEQSPKLLEDSTDAMGTVFSIKLYGANERRMRTAIQQALEEAQRLDRVLSNYVPISELSHVNQCAAKSLVTISPELMNLFRICGDYSRASDGSFDITVGALMRVWGFYKGSGRLPSASEIQSALENVGYRNLELDPANRTVRFKKAGVNLDPGGVGKGYAVDRIVAILLSNGIRSGLISAGGSSIYGIGTPPDDARGWHIRIRDPKQENRTAAELYLHNDSLSTSGNYEKFFWADGKLYSHIMDPRTGYPARGMLSVSVVAPRALDSEVWAKPYYILGRTWTERHKPKTFRVLMCEDKPGTTCAWLP
jgi:thiamine biosynthesis lipoprotein